MEKITKEELEQFKFQAEEWWSNIGDTQRLFRLLAYKDAFKVDIDYPNIEQITTLYALEVKQSSPSKGGE